MRFVAGRGAVAELLLAGALWRKTIGNQLLAEAPWRRAIGNQLLAGTPWRSCIGKPTNAHKREGPGRDLNISPEPLLFIALRKGNTPCDEAEPPFTSGIHRRHAVLAKLPLQLCRDCKEGCSKCKNCVELWEYGKDKGVTEYILSV